MSTEIDFTFEIDGASVTFNTDAQGACEWTGGPLNGRQGRSFTEVFPAGEHLIRLSVVFGAGKSARRASCEKLVVVSAEAVMAHEAAQEADRAMRAEWAAKREAAWEAERLASLADSRAEAEAHAAWYAAWVAGMQARYGGAPTGDCARWLSNAEMAEQSIARIEAAIADGTGIVSQTVRVAHSDGHESPLDGFGGRWDTEPTRYTYTDETFTFVLWVWDVPPLTASDYDYDASGDTAAWVNPSECVEYTSTPESRALQGIRDAMARARAATTLAETDAALSAALDAVYAAKGIAPQGVASSIIKARKSLRDAARTETRMTVGEPADVMARMDALLAHRARQAARGAAQTSETTVGASGATDNAAQPQEERMTEFVNLTPHTLNIQRADGTMLEIPASGQIARCAEVREERSALDGIAVSVATFGEVAGLPEPREGVVYIVSGLVLAAVPHRADVFAPGPALRDEAGKIVGSVGLSATPAYNAPKGTD